MISRELTEEEVQRIRDAKGSEGLRDNLEIRWIFFKKPLRLRLAQHLLNYRGPFRRLARRLAFRLAGDIQ